MSAHADPEELRQFLFECVSTYEELELLLRLHTPPLHEWDVGSLSLDLGITPDRCQVALENLVDRELLVVNAAASAFRYSPKRASLATSVDDLARAYREARVTIIQLMSTNAVERVRTAAIRSFADAFRIRERK